MNLLAFKVGVLINTIISIISIYISIEHGKHLAVRLGISHLKSEHSLKNNAREKSLEQKCTVILYNN